MACIKRSNHPAPPHPSPRCHNFSPFAHHLSSLKMQGAHTALDSGAVCCPIQCAWMYTRVLCVFALCLR